MNAGERQSVDGGPANIGRRRFIGSAAVGSAAALVAGCSTLERTPAAPPGVAEHTTVLGIPNARFWPETQTEALYQEAEQALAREEAALGRSRAASGGIPPAYFLAISGGSDDGAFGAGVLCGWSDSGKIPSFKLVTGISTGAMIAPLAFLGRPYNERLRAMYTTIGPNDIFEKRGLTAILSSEAVADTTPLFGMISRYLDERTLADIAREYGRGRLLLIGTTSLDQQRPVIWNIGAIAASGKPGALELVRKVILASAAVPGLFPPVMLEVEAGGHRYQEMNVDGGAVAQVFLYPPNVAVRAGVPSGRNARERHAYIIRNGRLDPNWASVDRRLLTITGRAISTMIYASGYNDLVRMYAFTRRDGVDYNLAYIESDFPNIRHEDFDPTYLRSLFDYGYQKALRGYPWHKAPPNLEVNA